MEEQRMEEQLEDQPVCDGDGPLEAEATPCLDLRHGSTGSTVPWFHRYRSHQQTPRRPNGEEPHAKTSMISKEHFTTSITNLSSVLGPPLMRMQRCQR